MKGRVYFSFAVSGKGNYYNGKLALNKWHHFRVTQTLREKQYIYTVYMNDNVIVTKVNTRPQDFKNVKVFAADNIYEAQPGYIKNLKFTG